MDFIIFLVGAGFFAGGFFLLLFLLWKKKSIVIPFVLMGVGVLICFVGLMLSSPLTDMERNTAPLYEKIHTEQSASSAVISTQTNKKHQ
ncbi:hypothetical protein [Bacillus piscicola]|uniref:hypothetical protein n=1 Tax=Bacillus piscicola TaxID=1632684 RepID=UPI001F09229C|nr:hypothetical protein [Bacillus piscicola]